MPALLYEDDLVLCCELEEELKVIVGHFFEVYKRRGLKLQANKSSDGVRWRGGITI